MGSHYTFIWGNTQFPRTVEKNILCLKRYNNIIWNQIDNIIQVSRNNRISTFHSTKDLEKDVEKGRNWLSKEFADGTILKIDQQLKKNWDHFNFLKNLDVHSLSNEQIYSNLEKAWDNWMRIISYFRSIQGEPTHYLTECIKKRVGHEDAFMLMTPTQMDVMNKELMDWQYLIHKQSSDKDFIKHAEKYPWIVPNHNTYQEIIETLSQRYDYDKKNLKIRDLAKEKNELNEKQMKVLSRKLEVKHFVVLAHQLALLRTDIKAVWSGTEFYIIPLMNEVAKRSSEKISDINDYYLMEEVKLLLSGIKLAEKTKHERKQCFVGLWKDGEATFVWGDKAEELARKELGPLYKIGDVSELKGTAANPGYLKGIARILPSNNIQKMRELREDFKKGQILITEMTQPNIMDIASKAGAIVTDEGGLLSHAAIISREFKIPCIVGTHFATATFKDGDIIEVDATKGIVKIIKNEK